MSFNIPGYFLDKKTKKLFKITQHGPFSLKELQKRVQREEAEEQEQAISSFTTTATLKKSSFHRQPTNMVSFLRQRATNTRNIPSENILFLMSRLRPRSKVLLEGSKQLYNNMIVDLLTDPEECGEIVMSYRTGRIARCGYQLNSDCKIWHAGLDWSATEQQQQHHAEVTSLQFGKRKFYLNGQERRIVVGTSGGCLWRYSMPVLPPLLEQDIMQLQVGNINATPHTSYTGYTESTLDCLLKKKKDLFWTSCLDDVNDNLVVGGDQFLYHLTSNFDVISSRRVKSSIFAVNLPKSDPNICYTGARNGSIQSVDFRHKQPLHYTPKFKHSSSITNIQALNNDNHLLTVGMDGAVHIWDLRQPKINNCKEPIRKLRGHINESSHHLSYDVELDKNLLLLAGIDGYVRIWSIYNTTTNEPLWKSELFDQPVPSAKFIMNYPKSYSSSSSSPGILLFGASQQSTNTSSIQCLTSIK